MRCCTVTRYILLLASLHFKTGKNEESICEGEKLEWLETAAFCFRNDSVLESNKTIIENNLNHMMKNYDIWIGKYEAWTPWFATLGCYENPGAVPNGQLKFFDCQKLCANDNYFSVKNHECFCIQDVHSFQNVSYTPCDCDNCFKVFQQNFDVFDNGKTVSSKRSWCMAAQCSGLKYQLTREECHRHYAVQCDNDNEVRSKGMNQTDAEMICAEIGSFIKWYPENICDNGQHETYLNQHWTSANQIIERFSVDGDKNQTLNPIRCLKRLKGHQPKYQYAKCSEENHFFCRFDTKEGHRTHLSSFSSCESNEDNTSIDGVNSGAVAGSIVAALIIMILIIIAVFLYKRREKIFDKKRKGTPQSPIPERGKGEETVYTEINDEQLQNESRKNGYSFAVPTHNPVGNETVIEPGYTQICCDKITCDDTKILENNDKSYVKVHKSNESLQSKNKLFHDYRNGTIDRQDLNFETNEIRVEKSQYSKSNTVNVLQNDNYSLAQPVRDSTEMDPYSDNQGYDKLNSVKKNDGNDKCKLYDHLPTTKESDPTYDHSGLHLPQVHDNNYDQNPTLETNKINGENSQFVKSNPVNALQNNNYSLAKPVRESAGSDPYSDNKDYDKLNSVKKKDGDTQCKIYDHLPTTQETDPTYDHTIIHSPKGNNNNYDQFSFDDDKN